jgi:uncharacterized protein with HEPN domain
MSKRDDRILIADMIEHASDAIEFVGQMSFEEFCQDKKTKAAVIRCIQTVGEAAGRVSEETRARLSEIPWKAIIGMRNILVHRYFNLDEEALWKVVQSDLKDLIATLHKAAKPD